MNLEEEIMAVGALMQGRVPDEIKATTSAVIKESGLTVSDIIRITMTRIAREKRIPVDWFEPNQETLIALEEIEKGKAKVFSTEESFFRDLYKKD